LIPSKLLISVVVPVFNEEANILPFYDAVCAETQKLEGEYRFEFVFTDNQSSDQTFPLLRGLAERDSRIHAYRFSRNFRLISRRIIDLFKSFEDAQLLSAGNDRYDGFQADGNTVQPQCEGSGREQVPVFQTRVAGDERHFESLGGAASSLDLFWADGVGDYPYFNHWAHVGEADLQIPMACWLCDTNGTKPRVD
jgi:glycosyltransferase involved in cell wall biosynthesis